MPPRNWAELPSDLAVNILRRVGAVDILENAQMVCTAWHEICYRDPSMWRVIYLDTSLGHSEPVIRGMLRLAVVRSQGELLDLTVTGFFDYELLWFVVERSPDLRRLDIVCYFGALYGVCAKVFRILPLLEELSIAKAIIKKEDIEAAGRFCPLLKTLKVNYDTCTWNGDVDGDVLMTIHNEVALAIGKNLPGLTHLELIRSDMKNTGLEAILDGCCRLESLDLRGCRYLELNGDLGKRCLRQIKHVKLPHCHESV